MGGPTGPFGPSLRAILAMFAGSYRLAKRPIQQRASDLFRLDIALGMISKLERRALSVTATCRQQGRNVWEFLTDCVQAQVMGRPQPSLLVPHPESG